MHWNHPKTILPHTHQSVEKVSSRKLVPGAKKLGTSVLRQPEPNCCSLGSNLLGTEQQAVSKEVSAKTYHHVFGRFS